MSLNQLSNMCMNTLLRGSRGWGWYYMSKDLLKQKKPKESELWKKPKGPRTQVYLDIGEEGKTPSRVVIELMNDVVPKTCENFVNLVKGTNGLCYKSCNIFDVRENTCVCSGSVKGKGNTGGYSSFNKQYFDDENFILKHDKAGVLTMMNAGSNRNSSLFAITLNRLPHLDGRNVVFGHVISGMEAIERIPKEFIVKGEPVQPILIQDCGVVEK